MTFSPFEQDTEQMAPQVVEDQFYRKIKLHSSHIIPKLFHTLIFVSTIWAAALLSGCLCGNVDIFEIFTV